MARKTRRYNPPRRRPGAARPDATEHQDQVEAAARQLAEQHTAEQLRMLLADRAALLQQSDQAGMIAPGPVNLARFRRARTEWEVAQRAVALSDMGLGPAPVDGNAVGDAAAAPPPGPAL
jgi:hypothetical protein